MAQGGRKREALGVNFISRASLDSGDEIGLGWETEVPDKERAQYQSNGRLGEVAVIAIKVQSHYSSISCLLSRDDNNESDSICITRATYGKLENLAERDKTPELR